MAARQHSAEPDGSWLAHRIASFWDFELVTSFFVEPPPERWPNRHWRAARLTDEETRSEIYTEGLTRTNATDGLVWMTFTPLKGMSEVVFMFKDCPGF